MDKPLSTGRGATERTEKKEGGGGDGGGQKRRREGGDDGGQKRQHRGGRDGARRRDNTGRRDGGRGGGGGGKGRRDGGRGGRGGRGRGGGDRGGDRKSASQGGTRFTYKWTMSPDNVRILTVQAFGSEVMSVSSKGDLTVDTGGFKTFRAFQALNMLLSPVGLRVIADPDGKGAGYKGGAWSVKHLKNGWALPFEDGMKLSAFPNRDWKRILPLLESLPEEVEFQTPRE